MRGHGEREHSHLATRAVQVYTEAVAKPQGGQADEQQWKALYACHAFLVGRAWQKLLRDFQASADALAAEPQAEASRCRGAGTLRGSGMAKASMDFALPPY